MVYRGGRILVVNGNASFRSTLDALLQNHGYHVTTAAHGAEALGWLIRRRFDLLLLDQKLPGMSGLELAHHASICQPDAMVLILTENAVLDDTPYRAPINLLGYISRNASPQDLLNQIDVALAQQRVVGE